MNLGMKKKSSYYEKYFYDYCMIIQKADHGSQYIHQLQKD